MLHFETICSEKSTKHAWKRRKCSLPAFSPFHSVFKKNVYCRITKTQDFLVKGKTARLTSIGTRLID